MGNRHKAEMRSEMRKVLSSLDERWLQAASREVCSNLTRIIEHDIKSSVSKILAWVSFFPGEVDLTAFISDQLGKREVYLPKSMPDCSMNFVAIGNDWLERMQSGVYGIPEPDDSWGKTFDTALAPMTAVIVPGLAFNAEGHRLGRGRGFYDRFFARPHMLEAHKIGVCWELQMRSDIECSHYDVPVDWICHERFGFRTEKTGVGV